MWRRSDVTAETAQAAPAGLEKIEVVASKLLSFKVGQMTRKIARFLAASLLAGVALPAFAQTTVAPPVAVEVAPLAPAAAAPADPGAPSAAAPSSIAEAPGVIVDPLADAIASALTAAEGTARGFVEKRRAAAVDSFYDERAYRPVWVDEAGLTTRARAAMDRLGEATADGLDPAAFAVPPAPQGFDARDLAAFDLALSHAVVAFAEEASGGRLVPNTINSKFITRKPERADPIAALRTVSGATDAAAALDGFNPPHEGFRRLKEKLAEVRARPDEPPPAPIPAGPSLKPGMVDPRVPLLRTRLELPEPAGMGAEVYDEAMVEAVRAFQKGAGLLDDGIVGPRTLAVLNGADRDEEGQILANMEMWRWMPRELGTEHVLVNIPEFMVRVVRHGEEVHKARVVVGTQTNQTPVFSDEMEYLVVNPYWHVPESIRMKEMLPEIQADPGGFFRRNGYEAVWNGQVIDPTRVLWDENAIKYVGIRQPPSEANALGRIKFMFPNQHAVYLHDTPSRKLFQRDWRAYSHGCVRVDDPMEFARAILEDERDIDVDRLTALFGGPETRVDLTQHIKVHIAYFTAWVDADGVLQMRDDLYGHAAKVKAALEDLAAATN